MSVELDGGPASHWRDGRYIRTCLPAKKGVVALLLGSGLITGGGFESVGFRGPVPQLNRTSETKVA